MNPWSDMFTARRVIRILLVVTYLVIVPGCATEPDPGPLRNVILFIGDGMGPEQVKAGGCTLHGEAGTLSFEAFPYQAVMTTHAADNEITDSAASATAMATGVKVNNRVVSMQIPGDQRDLPTLLELFQEQGKRTGLVTTSEIPDATTACFGAHAAHRRDYEEILADLHKNRPAVLFGGHGNTQTPALARAAGYTVVRNAAELSALAITGDMRVSGQFDRYLPYSVDGLGELPSLAAMTRAALKILERSEHGFFLVVEGAAIDWAGHLNDLERLTGEVIAFSHAVQVALTWREKHKDTLIVVTADHETGGLSILKNNGKGKLPEVKWQTKGHTATPVPVYAIGPGAKTFVGRIDNTDIFKKIAALCQLKTKVPTKPVPKN